MCRETGDPPEDRSRIELKGSICSVVERRTAEPRAGLCVRDQSMLIGDAGDDVVQGATAQTSPFQASGPSGSRRSVPRS